MNVDNNLLYKEEVYKIIGAAYEVYNQLGNGFLEAVYQEALEIEFEIQKIPYISQKELNISYKNRQLKQKYKPDFLVNDKIIVEIKGIPRLTNNEISQLINYLKTSGLKVGLLLNFGGQEKLEWKRVVF